MTNLTIGRIGLDIDVADVSQWDMNGSVVDVSFSTAIDDLAEANAIRQQLLGYVDTAEEDFVPVTWADDPTVDGFYRVLSADVTPDPDLAFDGLYYFHAQLQRITGYAAPIIEQTVLVASRPGDSRSWEYNPLALATVPAVADDVTQVDPITNEYYVDGNPHTRTGSDGLGIRLYDVTFGSLWPPDNPVRCIQYSVPPAEAYAGASKITLDGFAVVGRQIENRPFAVEVANSLVKVAILNDVADKFRVSITSWQQSTLSWATPIIGKLRFGTSTSRQDVPPPHTITILENNPEQVAVRFHAKRPDTIAPLVVDITVRRGMLSAYFRVHSPAGATAYPSVAFESNVFDSPGTGRSLYGYYNPGGTFLRTNRAPNPRAGLDGVNWHAYTGTETGRVTYSIGSGPRPEIRTGYRATATGAHASTAFGAFLGDPGVNLVTAGTEYTISAYAQPSVTRSCQLRLTWRDSGGGTVSTTTADTQSASSSGWTRFSTTVTAPVGAVRVDIGVTGEGGTAWSAAQRIDVTGILLETGATLNAYYDGWYPLAQDIAAKWDGNEHSSVSHLYDVDDDTNLQGQYVLSMYRLGKTNSEVYPETSGGSQNETTWDFGVGRIDTNAGETMSLEGTAYTVTNNVRENVAIR